MYSIQQYSNKTITCSRQAKASAELPSRHDLQGCNHQYNTIQ